MKIELNLDELYGEYVFSPFSSEESFYTYIEEVKREWKEGLIEEGVIDEKEKVIFIETKTEKKPLMDTMDLADYCGMLYKDEKGFWRY